MIALILFLIMFAITYPTVSYYTDIQNNYWIFKDRIRVLLTDFSQSNSYCWTFIWARFSIQHGYTIIGFPRGCNEIKIFEGIEPALAQ